MTSWYTCICEVYHLFMFRDLCGCITLRAEVYPHKSLNTNLGGISSTS